VRMLLPMPLLVHAAAARDVAHVAACGWCCVRRCLRMVLFGVPGAASCRAVDDSAVMATACVFCTGSVWAALGRRARTRLVDSCAWRMQG
jgi:hypothetical protein